LPHYVSELNSKPYLYGNHYGPHDLEVKEMGTGKSRREAAYSLGLNFRVVPRLPVEDGIHAARMTIPRCWFDQDNCRKGLEALRHYHRAYNERTRKFRDQPVHNWASHAADAFRYMSVSMERMNTFNGKAPQPHAVMDYNPYNEYQGIV
jgi:phage terminase large subunit